MKKRSTTPVSKLTKRGSLIAIAILMAALAPVAFLTPTTKARDFDAEIRAVQRQIDQYNAEAKKLADKADTLKNKIAQLDSERAIIQASIDLEQAKHDKIVADIKANEKKIADNQSYLGKTMADMYVADDISALEMLASTDSVADYIDKQSQRESIRDSLSDTIKKIRDIKAELEVQKKQVEDVLENQKRARSQLESNRAEQQQLMSETRGEEAAYKKLSGDAEARKREVMEAQQAAIRAASANNGGVAFVGGSDGGYPWNNSNCVMLGMYSTIGADGRGGDGWGYGCRQCASYVAWKIGQHTGVIPTYLGNANNFPGNLSHRPQGYTARANSVGVIMAGAYGHVVWVETDPDANGFITVSQYNANYGGGWGNFSRVIVHQSTYDKYIYY